MRWTKSTTFALATLVALEPTVAAVIVIRANGPSAAHYPAGRSIADSTQLLLQRGDDITLLDADGTRTISGPGTFPARGSTAATGPSRLVALASIATERRARVGAVRNLPDSETSRRPNIFFVDVNAPGATCIVDSGSVSLWRADTKNPGSVQITTPDGRSAVLTWIKGQSTLAWPASLSVLENAEYRITQTSMQDGPSAPLSTSLSFKLLKAAPTDLPQLASALIAGHCQSQIDLLVATTSSTSTSKPTGS